MSSSQVENCVNSIRKDHEEQARRMKIGFPIGFGIVIFCNVIHCHRTWPGMIGEFRQLIVLN